MKINGNPDGGGGGAAVWGGITGNINSQTDLNQKFVKKTGLKTVNEQSLVGEGDIEVGTLNPEDLKTINSTSLVGEGDIVTGTLNPGDLKTINSTSLVGEGDIVTGTLNPGDLKTINSQSIVGEGDIEIGGLTPQQEAAIEPLVNSEEGILYTSVFGPNSVKAFICSAPEISSRLNKIYNVGGGDIYYPYNNQLWKYNPQIMDFELIATLDSNVDHIWKDTQGGLHSGKDYDIDLTTRTVTYHQRSTGYGLSNIDGTNRINIFVGSKGVYDLNNTTQNRTKSYKYDNQTELFNTGQYLAGDSQSAVRLCCSFIYKGHYLFLSQGNIYEVTEGDDEVLTTSTVTDVYFSMPSDFTIDSKYNLFVVNGDLYYIYQGDTYRWDDDSSEWVSLNLSGYDGGFNNSYVVSGDYVIGGISSQTNELYFINLGSNTLKSTSWTEPKNVAVDLKSDQIISGMKKFAYVGAAEFVFLGNDSTLNVKDSLTLTGKELDVNIPVVNLNGNALATRNMCYVNRSLVSPGINFEDICQIPKSGWSNPEQNWKMWYKMPSGDIFYVNDYRNYVKKYDPFDNEFETVSTVSNKIASGHRAVLNQGSELWVSKNGNVYRWNDINEDFDLIISTPDGGDWIWQGDDTTLRYKDLYVLTYDSGTGTYNWDQVLTAPTFNECYSYILNGQIFLYVPYMNAIYTWDELSGQESLVYYLDVYPEDDYYLAPVGNYFYYYADNGYTIRKIDVTKAGSGDFDVITNIPSGSSGGSDLPPIFEYDSKYCTQRNYNGNEYFCYTYDYSYWAPQPDTSTDGTYTLKATVLNGQVTYSWVADV